MDTVSFTPDFPKFIVHIFFDILYAPYQTLIQTIFLRFVLLPLGQLHDFLSDSEVTLNDMGKIV